MFQTESEYVNFCATTWVELCAYHVWKLALVTERYEEWMSNRVSQITLKRALVAAGGERRPVVNLPWHNSIISEPYLCIISCGVIIRQHSYLLLTALTYSHRIWYGVRWIYSKSFQTSEGWTTHNLPIHSFGTSSPWAEGRPCLLQTTVYHRLTLLLEEDMSPSRHAEAEKICRK